MTEREQVEDLVVQVKTEMVVLEDLPMEMIS